jgi:6-hydroxytryprostatin B O-methyltransferase
MEGSVIVDVGGGVGSASLAILNKFPELRFVVQDLPAPIADGRRVRSFRESQVERRLMPAAIVLGEEAS